MAKQHIYVLPINLDGTMPCRDTLTYVSLLYFEIESPADFQPKFLFHSTALCRETYLMEFLQRKKIPYLPPHLPMAATTLRFLCCEHAHYSVLLIM